MVMNLELLPNEIFLDIFDYLDGVNLLRAFAGLNSHFNSLLDNLFQNYNFKFNSVSKSDFDIICQDYLPSFPDRIIALRLSDFNDTPGQINLFLSYNPSFDQFTHLRSLTIISVDSYDILLKIIDKCHSLPNLTDLNLCFCYLRDNNMDCQLIINNIWNLPKLIHCNFGIEFPKQKTFSLPTIISSSLKSLNISSKLTLKMNQINQLFEYTPCLKCLSVCTESYINERYIQSSLPTLIELNINSCYLSDISKMIILLQHMPNLCRLKINLTFNLIDGNQWEDIIRNSLPKLKIFQLTMKRMVLLETDIPKRVDELINSFQTSFWIDEHKWFVRCLVQEKTIFLYTVSNTNNLFEEIIFYSWKSTYPLDNQQGLFINKTNIYNETFFDQPIPSIIRLFNIENLWIKFPINGQFWSAVPNLNQLNTLRVSSYLDTFQYQLQALLDRAPNLRSLTIHKDVSLPLQMSLFKNTHASIRRFNLMNYNHYFNEDDCLILVHSPLVAKCEVLSILVKNYECIVTLVKNMANLRALNARCEDENKNSVEKMVNEDKTVRWLKGRLPSTCLIVNNSDSVSDISIWIQ